MDTKSIRVANLTLVLVTMFNGDRAKLAQALGYSNVNYLNQLLSGNGSFGARTAKKISDQLGLKDELVNGVAVNWIDIPRPEDWKSKSNVGSIDLELPALQVSGSMETDSDLPKNAVRLREPDSEKDVFVLQYKDVRFSAGPGYQNPDHEELEAIAFKPSSLGRMGLDRTKCFIVYATGESMETGISDGDAVLVNTQEKDLFAKDGRIFAFRHGDDCRIKRVYTTLKREVRLVSDNPDKVEYPDEIFSEDQINTLVVEGRVRWVAGFR